jgi:hypothetical protein
MEESEKYELTVGVRETEAIKIKREKGEIKIQSCRHRTLSPY